MPKFNRCIILILFFNFAVIYSATLSIISPNGSEVWDPTVRPTRKITWSATNTVEATADSYVNISYSQNGGTSWISIISNTPNDGSHDWDLPLINSENCRIRITTSGATDESDADFTINNPEIFITSISSGQELVIDSTYQIKWDYANHVDDSVYARYTVNGGADWTDIKTLAYNDSCDWQIPAIPSTNCFLRVIDKHCSDNVYYEIPFSIVFGIVNITYPNTGSESFIGGTTETITWESEGLVGDVRIDYSIDNGSSWELIDSSTENDGQYDWVIPDVATSNCRIRITSNTYGVYGVGDTCDNNFALELTPRIALTSPNGRDNWIFGTQHNITWTSVNLKSGVHVEYSSDSGSTWSTIANNTPNDGVLEWTIPNDISTNCIVRVSESLDGDPIDQSDTVFTIAIPEIDVVSPNGGEEWYFNETNMIEWTSVGTVGNVKIEYSSNGLVWLLATLSTPNDGSYSWITPQIHSENYEIRISDASNAAIIDKSDSLFTITTRPTITLVSPNGGESWTEGTEEEIQWSTTGAVEMIRIEYTSDNGANWNLIADSVENSSSYLWGIPRDPSTTCRVRVTDVARAEVTDRSDQTFSLLVAPALALTYPAGGEEFEFGTTQEIRWETEGIVGDVRIEYSSDSGSTWNFIGTSTSNVASYNWTIPEDSSVNYFVRVMEIADSIPADTSVIPFEVYGRTITVNFPNGGESLSVGNPYNITWASRGTVGNVKIEYKTEISNIWNEVVNTTENDGSFNWTIPDEVSTDCKIRISEVARPAITDTSNSSSEIIGGTVRIISHPQSLSKMVRDSAEFSIAVLGLTPITYQWQKNGVDITSAINDTFKISSVSISDSGSYTCIATNAYGSDTSSIAVLAVNGKEIFIASPDSAAVLYGEDTCLIEWSTNGGVGNVQIEYSIDSGVTWNTIISSVENSGSYSWVISNEESVRSLLRITETSDPTITAISDNLFEIRKPCKVILSSGWNMISFNRLPIDQSVESVFADIESLVLVKNNDGQVYMPAYSQNDIGDIVITEGYLVYTTVADTIKVKGELVNTTITLNPGWSLIPYFPQERMSIETALSSIVSSIKLVKNNLGQVYMPAYNQNDIGDMIPGEAYQIYMDESANLIYSTVD